MRKIILKVIRAYQWGVSPLLGPNCRFHPTCSQYAYESLRQFGILRGGSMSIVRLLKCHPFHEGGVDPVPKVK